MNELNGNVPMLGQQKIKAAPQMLVSLIRHMDEDGTFEPENTQLNNGVIQAVAGRANLASAEDLVDMVVDALMPQLRIVIREEIKKAYS